MEKRLDKSAEVCKELLDCPKEKSVTNFSEYIRQELNLGHITQLSACFKSLTDAVAELSDTDSTLYQLFELDVHLIIPFIPLIIDRNVCKPDAVKLLISLFRFLNAACEKLSIGKTKLAVLIPVLIRDILMNEGRGVPLRFEAIKLINVILADVVNDEMDPTDHISLALKELEGNMEHVLSTAGDIELQAGLVECIFRLIPCDVRRDKAQEYFSSISVSQAFTSIAREEFEVGCRSFLNTLNWNQKEKQSVISFPCNSAKFGTEEVHGPMDEKLQDFWVDFNFGSKSISLFVEERDKEYDEKGSGSWETALIKAVHVEDYRFAGAHDGDIALLLKLNVPASDLVSFLPLNPSQYIKFSFNGHYTSSLRSVLAKNFGRPERKTQTDGGDSDTSSTPSKASVAINPVHIRSKNTDEHDVMPTASNRWLQLSSSTTDPEEVKVQEKANRSISGNHKKPDENSTENTRVKDVNTNKDEALDQIQVDGLEEVDGSLDDLQPIPVDASTTRRIQNESVPSGEDARHESGRKGLRTRATKSVKRASERLQKMQSVKYPSESDNPTDGENKKRDSSEKALPSAFNVSSRLAASKRKSMLTEPLLESAKSRKAIKEKVFAKAGRSFKRVENRNKPTDLHLVTPARRREPRSGKRRSGTCTSLPVDGYKKRKADKSKSAFSSSSSNVFSETSDISCYNQGGVSRNRTRDDNADNREERVDVIQDSLPLADSLEDESGPNKQDTRAPYKGPLVKKSKVKESRQRRESALELAAKNRKRTKILTAKTSGLKRSTTNKRTSGKQQKRRDPFPLDKPQVSNSESEDIPENQNEPEVKRKSTNKRASQSVKRTLAKQREPPPVDKNEVSNSESDDVLERYNQTSWEVNDDDPIIDIYGDTEGYIEEASPLIASPPVANIGNKTRRQSTVTRDASLGVSPNETNPKKKRPVANENSKSDTPKTRPYEREFRLNTEKTPQVQRSDEESGVNSEEEEIQESPVKRAKITPKVNTPRELSQQTEVSNVTGLEEEKEDTEEEVESVHSDAELDYEFNVNITPRLKTNPSRQNRRLHGPSSGRSNLKRSMLLDDSGIGETPFGEEMQKRSKVARKRSWKPLQVSVTKTPITPRSDNEEQGEDTPIDAETYEEFELPPDHESPEEIVDKRQAAKRKFYDWSKSGPSTLHDPSGTRASRTEGWYEEPLHLSEARVLYRSQHFGKPRKLSYDDEPHDDDVQENEEVISESSEEDVRREVQGLINIAGSEVFKAVRRKRNMVKSFLQRSNEMMLSTYDTYWNDQQVASHNTMKKYKSQLTDQIQTLEKDFNKTASTIKSMEDTVNTFTKQSKILKNQRQIEEKRFKGLQHMQRIMETELTTMEQRRNEQESTFRAELEKETSKFQKKFLQDARKQKEDHLKMILNILRIP